MFMLQNGGGDPNLAVTEINQTPLHLACAGGFLDVAKYLVSKGANPLSKDVNDATPFLHACQTGNVELIQYLMDLGCDYRAVDVDKWTALHRAAHCGRVATIQKLLGLGLNKADVDAHGNTPLALAQRFKFNYVKAGTWNEIKKLLS